MIPIPTTVNPITAPVLNATCNALFNPDCAAVAVRVLPLTAMFMPIKPASPDPIAPITYAIAVHGPSDVTAPP